MAYQNIFSVKKTKPQMSTVSSAYKPNNPVSAFGQAAAAGQGITQVQKLAFAQPKAPQMSAAPRLQQNMSVAPKLIQGSGYGSNYASNASNQPVRTPQPIPQPIPQPTAVPTPTPQPQAVDPTQVRINDVSSTGTAQQQFAENARKKQEEYIKQQYDIASQQLGEQLPAAEAQFGRLKANTEASIADLLAGGERQKAQATDYYGDAQRQAAKNRRQVQGQTQRIFANLGTLDSRGEGSFQEATENQDSEFNRYTQQNLKAKADKLSEIDMGVKAAERQALATITQEEAKLSELARNIKYAQANNNLQQARELTDAYNTTQQYIYEIEDSVSQMKYQFALEQQKLVNEMKKTQTFTPEFMAGGAPTNQAEYEFFIKNQKDLQSAYGNAPAKTKSASQLQIEGKSGAGLRALDTIEAEILNNPNILAQASIYGSPGARQYDAAISSITDAIGGLRTGASVSPEQQKYYRNILPKMGDSKETIQYKLNAIRQELQGYTQGASSMSGDIPPELLSILGL